MMDIPLEDFILEYKGLVHLVVNSLHSSYLDSDDLSELQYDGLWKVWKTYDQSKVGACSINTYITTVIRNKARDIIRKKTKWYSRERELTNNLFYIHDESEYNYTEEEWKFIKPSLEGKTLKQIHDELGISHKKYKYIRKLILEKRK
jgi:RNA polymerase sigma factor (sigma-70 family)